MNRRSSLQYDGLFRIKDSTRLNKTWDIIFKYYAHYNIILVYLPTHQPRYNVCIYLCKLTINKNLNFHVVCIYFILLFILYILRIGIYKYIFYHKHYIHNWFIVVPTAVLIYLLKIAPINFP